MRCKGPQSLVLLVLMLVPTGRATAQDCYRSSILSPAPFMGNNDEVLKLADGSVWQVKYEYEYMYEYYPSVTICPTQGKLIVGKKSLTVQRISGPTKGPDTRKEVVAPAGNWEVFEETALQGSISGTVTRGRVFTTVSGNVYEVTGLTLQLVLELQPSVVVLRNGAMYKLVVEGFDEPLICRRLGSQAPPPPASSVADVVESRIDGEFSGWEGETIFKLQNGQIWQQSGYAYKYRYRYSPKVLIYKSGSVYKMKVDGVDGEVQVRQLK